MRAPFLLCLLLAAAPALAQERFPATLVGHAILPAATLIDPPADAPPGFALSGRFTGPDNTRTDTPGTLPGEAGSRAAPRPTGLSLPFRGQPVQGLSGLRPAGDGSFWAIADNGFGTRRNSPDALLMLHRLRPDWATGAVAREQTLFLSDPSRAVPFHIVTDPSPTRYLTGADFDPEAIEPIPGGGFWIAEEFGPTLIRLDAEGRVVAGHELTLGAERQVMRSPDHYAEDAAADTAPRAPTPVRRSGGFESLGMTADGRFLWAGLEKGMRFGDADADADLVRFYQFDLARGDWTGAQAIFQMADDSHSVSDLAFLDDRRALLIERDQGEGDPSLACRPRERPPACFGSPAAFKRVVLVDFGALERGGVLPERGHIDLLDIADPDRRARTHGDRGAEAPADRFAFPFVTPEAVAVVDADHIVLVNDNNLPFSAGRHLARADDSEFILLRVPELLRAR